MSFSWIARLCTCHFLRAGREDPKCLSNRQPLRHQQVRKHFGNKQFRMVFNRNTGGNNLTTIIDAYGSVQGVQLDNPGQAAVQFGLNANSSHAVAQQLPVDCPSGNCTWPVFESLAVCSKCTNLDDKIQSATALDFPMSWFFPPQQKRVGGSDPENLTSYYLPNGLNLDNRKVSYYVSSSPAMLTSKATLKPSETMTFENSTTLLFSASVLRVPPSDFPTGGTWQSEKVQLSAMECGLYLCIKRFDSKVVNGSLTEQSNEIVATRDPDSFAVNLGDNAGTLSYRGKVSPNVDALFSENTFFPRTPLVIKMPPGSNSSNLHTGQVSIPQSAIDSLSSYVLSIFDEGTYANNTAPGNATGCTFGNSSIPCAGPRNISGMAIGNGSLTMSAPSNPIKFSPIVTKLLYNSNDLNELFGNIAASITNEMRRSADNQTSLSGQLGTLRTVLHVRWAWLAFPAVLVVSSFVFLVIAMIEAHRTAVPLWRSSTMAVLFHGIEKVEKSAFDSIEKASEMESRAKKLHLQLRRGGLNECKFTT
jgi:hypothetical protein